MKKRVITILIAMCIGVMQTSFCYASISNKQDIELEQVKNSYKDKNIVILGDSIGSGFKLESASDSYSMLLSNKLQMNCTNIAVNGTKTKELFERLDSTDLNSIKNADVINVSIGGNDILQPLLSYIREKTNTKDDNADFYSIYMNNQEFFDCLLDGKYDDEINSIMQNGFNDFLEYYDKTIDKIQNINGRAVIILQTISNPLANISYFDHISKLIDNYICKVNNIIIEKGNNKNIYVADVYNALKEESGMSISNIGDFDIHPNKIGHYDIYLCIYKALINEYPNDISVDITGATYRFAYNKDTLSPEIYIKPNEGYKMQQYLEAISNKKSYTIRGIKQENGEYKYILKPHILSDDIKIVCHLKSEEKSEANTLPMIDDESDKMENLESETVNDSKSKLFYDSNKETVSEDNTSSSQELKTSDNVYKFVLLFIICLTIAIYRFFKFNMRKE